MVLTGGPAGDRTVAAGGQALEKSAFYERLRGFLVEHRPDLDGEIEPSTQLWVTGYLDSFGLIETISFLEELLGRPIEIGADDLPSFFTMKDMYWPSSPAPLTAPARPLQRTWLRRTGPLAWPRP